LQGNYMKYIMLNKSLQYSEYRTRKRSGRGLFIIPYLFTKKSLEVKTLKQVVCRQLVFPKNPLYNQPGSWQTRLKIQQNGQKLKDYFRSISSRVSSACKTLKSWTFSRFINKSGNGKSLSLWGLCFGDQSILDFLDSKFLIWVSFLSFLAAD